MNLAKVLGRVVASRKEESIEGMKLLMLGAAGPDGKLTGGSVVAVDAVGAGEGRIRAVRLGFVGPADGCHGRQAGRRGDHGHRRQLGHRRRRPLPQG